MIDSLISLLAPVGRQAAASRLNPRAAMCAASDIPESSR